MTNNEIRDAYLAAFAEASLELEKIFGEIEKLHIRRTRIERAVEVLGRRIESQAPVTGDPMLVERKTERAGLTVVTRVSVAQAATGVRS
jgi:hypothetical protein